MSVKTIQTILQKHGLYSGKIDGIYGPLTLKGIVSYMSEKEGVRVPYRPTPSSGSKALNNTEAKRLFGSFKYHPFPGKSGQSVSITDGWDKDNIVTVYIPELAGVDLYSLGNKDKASGNIRCHKLVKNQFVYAFTTIRDLGLQDRILTYSGAYTARYIKVVNTASVVTSLSNHCFGTAIDLNAQWNQLGKPDASAGSVGCVWELVPIFEAFGFYWGGWFNSKDGMHFEAFKVMSDKECAEAYNKLTNI